MTEQSPPETPLSQPPTGQPAAASAGADYPGAGSGQSVTDRPEVKIAGTFLGGLVAATILKRLGR